MEIAERLLDSSFVRVLHVDETLLRVALGCLRRRPDKRFSLTDCISFVVMDQLGLRDALAFDAHFAQAGFTNLPSVAL